MADNPRFFLSIEPSQGLKESLGACAAALAPLFARARPTWARPELFHLTLHFFGPAGPDFPRLVERAMRPAAAAAPRPNLRSAGFLYLPGEGRPRVLCLAFTLEPEGSLAPILAEARRIAAATGTQNESRPWLPHLTLARLKAPGAPPLSALPQSPRLEFSPASCSLFCSTLFPYGPRHERLADFEFALC
jgi:RNA 2',3'-cyclic 3'-phosphodiesterase